MDFYAELQPFLLETVKFLISSTAVVFEITLICFILFSGVKWIAGD